MKCNWPGGLEKRCEGFLGMKMTSENKQNDHRKEAFFLLKEEVKTWKVLEEARRHFPFTWAYGERESGSTG
jgi:hypothetical protein